MSKSKIHIEKLFEQLGYLICRNRFKTLVLMFVIIGLFVMQMPKLTVDTSNEGMFHKDDPLRIQYNDFRDEFGQDRIIIVTVQTPDIFTEKYLLKLKSLHDAFEEQLPHLDEVKSLINARVTRGEGDMLVVEDLLEDWPEKEIDYAKIRNFAVNNPVYRNDYISEDGRIAAFIIRPQAFLSEETDQETFDGFETDAIQTNEEQEENGASKSNNFHYISKSENKDIVDAVAKIVSQYEAPDFEIATAGGPVAEEVYDRITKETMSKLRMIMMVVILITLFILFRRISGAVFPLIIVYSALFSTMGVMAAAGVSVSIMSVVLPSFLMAVGVADSVHILAIFFRQYQKGQEKYDAIAYSLGHSGFAIVMTSLTTVAGLLSFSFSEIASIGHLGIFAAIGTGLALLYTVIMLPAFLAIAPIKRKKAGPALSGVPILDRILLFFTGLSVGNPKKILFVCAVLFAVTIAGMSQLEFALPLNSNFPISMKVRQDMDFIDENLKGIFSLEIVVDTKKENGLYEPEVLKRIQSLNDEITQWSEGDIFIGKIRSINDILRETNQALHGNNPAYYKIPDERTLVAQELFLFENSGSDDLKRIVDSRFSKTRISLKLSCPEAVTANIFIKKIHAHYQNQMEGLAEVSVTGLLHIFANGMASSIISMSKSYVIAFFVISVLMVILVGNLKLGFLSMIPNLLPIFMVIGFMGIAGISVDLVALLIGSIAIGLVVDDTMHFMYNYRRYYDIKKEPYFAVKETLLSTGRAILITSLVLSAGFFVILASPLNNPVKFGLYSGIIILIALLADFIVAPALMTLVTGKSTRKEVPVIIGDQKN